jgi:hypothetical protein
MKEDPLTTALLIHRLMMPSPSAMVPRQAFTGPRGVGTVCLRRHPKPNLFPVKACIILYGKGDHP